MRQVWEDSDIEAASRVKILKRFEMASWQLSSIEKKSNDFLSSSSSSP